MPNCIKNRSTVKLARADLTNRTGNTSLLECDLRLTKRHKLDQDDSFLVRLEQVILLKKVSGKIPK